MRDETPWDSYPGGCTICGQNPDDCLCPTCPACGEVGNPECYKAQRHLLEFAPLVPLGDALVAIERSVNGVSAEREYCETCSRDTLHNIFERGVVSDLARAGDDLRAIMERMQKHASAALADRKVAGRSKARGKP